MSGEIIAQFLVLYSKGSAPRRFYAKMFHILTSPNVPTIKDYYKHHPEAYYTVKVQLYQKTTCHIRSHGQWSPFRTQNIFVEDKEPTLLTLGREKKAMRRNRVAQALIHPPRIKNLALITPVQRKRSLRRNQ
uniref:Uncharacterized protein n=1 Tax=Anguilla anguilla TaxID=7936 RepID=A0A0E9XN23_ANGAN